MQIAKYFGFGFALTLMMFAVGCDSGPQMGTVTGTITLDGAPAPSLEVSFNPVTAGTGTTALAYTDASGNYKLTYPGGKTGAPVGEYKVSISPAETDGEAKAPASIPACYNTETTLTFTVAAGENTANFDLKSAGE